MVGTESAYHWSGLSAKSKHAHTTGEAKDMRRRRNHRTRLLLGREDLCRLRIAQLTALAYYLGYEVKLSTQPNPRCSGLIEFGRSIGVWAEDPEQQLSTLAHEICHAGLWELRIPWSFIERNAAGRVEEALCYAFSSFMLGVLLDRWPSYFRSSDVGAVQYFLSRFVEQLRRSLLHRCVHITGKKSKHEEALNLANGVRDGLTAFEDRWRRRRYVGLRDAATDIFENLFDLVDLCNGLIAEKKAQIAPDGANQEALF